MSARIQELARARGITRLCHFTPSRNLVHITTDPRGLLSSVHLKTDEKSVFNPTDLERLDGYPSHLCCSIQYPNAWYFRKAKNKERIFKDWVVLLLDPRHLWSPRTLFCARNAAAGRGAGVSPGATAFNAMFAPSVGGAYGKSYTRGASHPACLTTDDQAEVLIPDSVAREEILAICVADESQAKREHARLEQLQAAIPPIIIAPSFFEPYELSPQVRQGITPTEAPFIPGASR